MAEGVQVAGDLYHGVVPAGAVYVGRPAPGLPGSPWANPFKVGRKTPTTVRLAGRALTINGSARGPLRCMSGTTPPNVEYVITWYGALIEALDLADQIRAELAGKDLACWCRLTNPCHRNVLLAVANSRASLAEREDRS